MAAPSTVLLCLACLLGAVVPLAAAEPARPVPWNIIGGDGHTASSRCIGQPRTPLCAVETLLACFQWARPDLCRMVDDEAGQYAAIFSEPADPTKYLAYRVVVERQGPTADGEVIIEQMEMTSPQVIGAAPGTSSAFKLRRKSDGLWTVTGWEDLAN